MTELNAPKYWIIANDIIEAIKNGTYKANDKLPSTAELMQTYAVSQSVVTRAMDALTRNGWVRRQQGSGTYVENISHILDTKWQITSRVLAAMVQNGWKARVEQDETGGYHVTAERGKWRLYFTAAEGLVNESELSSTEAALVIRRREAYGTIDLAVRSDESLQKIWDAEFEEKDSYA